MGKSNVLTVFFETSITHNFDQLQTRGKVAFSPFHSLDNTDNYGNGR